MATIGEDYDRAATFVSNLITRYKENENPVNRALAYIGLTTTRHADRRATRAYESGFMDGNDDPQSGQIAAGGFGYRRQGQKGRLIDLDGDQILDTVWKLYQSNGIVKRSLSFQIASILGRNTAPETADETLQPILDEFWRRNLAYNRNLKRFLLAYNLFGELILPVFVRQADGKVLLGYIDQGEVEAVLFHPQNNLERFAVALKERAGDGQSRRVYRIIREDEGNIYSDEPIPPQYPGKLIVWQQAQLEPWETEMLQSYGLNEYSGSAFYFDKNNLANQPRGFSDLLQSADWLDQNDEVLFSLADREQFANFFSWDAAVEGSPEQVQKRESEIRARPPTGKGQINVHNKSEEWTFVTADLKQPGSIATAEATKTQALEGLNQPKHWHGEPDTTNRATAQSADNPVNRNLETEQGDMVNMLTLMCQFAADQAEIATFYKPAAGVDNAITISVPEIVKEDMLQVSQALTGTVNALAVAMLDLKIISRETASSVISKVISGYGVDYNPTEELAEIDGQMEQADLETQAEINAVLSQAIDNANT